MVVKFLVAFIIGFNFVLLLYVDKVCKKSIMHSPNFTPYFISIKMSLVRLT